MDDASTPTAPDTRMRPRARSASRRRATAIALGLACTWVLILLAGADHPPPPRFLLVLPFVLVGALLVYWRAAQYAGWKSRRRPWRVGRVIGEGALAGLALGGIIAVLPGPVEPGVHISGADVLLWLAVMGAVGSVNALLVYLFSTPSHVST